MIEVKFSAIRLAAPQNPSSFESIVGAAQDTDCLGSKSKNRLWHTLPIIARFDWDKIYVCGDHLVTG